MKLTVFAAALVISTTAALAQGNDPAGVGHSSMHGEKTSAAGDPVVHAFQDANARMHADMTIDFTGNANVDFVRSMIPHHQGAIDMANVMLEYGDDEELRALAEEIVEAQKAEIAEMREWLKRNGHEK